MTLSPNRVRFKDELVEYSDTLNFSPPKEILRLDLADDEQKEMELDKENKFVEMLQDDIRIEYFKKFQVVFLSFRNIYIISIVVIYYWLIITADDK